jgi:1,4-dihydroxy-2-naphthoate octaprenyltransferase
MAHPSIHHPGAVHSHAHDLLVAVFRLADPKISIASLVPFVAAVALAHGGARIAPSVVIAAYAAIFLVEVSKNAVNDLVDFRSGADPALSDSERSPFSGGKRVLVDGLIGEGELTIVGWVAMALAAAVGTWVATRTDPRLLLLGAFAAAVATAYSVAPFRLSYRGLGELAVGLTYGPGIVLGTMLLLTGGVTREAVVVAATLGILIAQVLIINEVPDERVDRLAGKRTLVVRLGRVRTGRLMEVLFSAAFVLPVVAATDSGPFRLMFLLAGIPAAVVAVALLERQKEGPPVMAQALTLLAYVSAGVVYTFAVIGL